MRSGKSVLSRPPSLFPRPSSSDNPAGITLWQGLPLLSCSVRAGTPQQGISELFSELHARLVEGVDPVQLSRVGRRDLEQHHQLADVARIHAVEMNRHVRSSTARQCSGGGALLDVDQLAEGMAGEIAELFYVGES